ncbi:MAG: LCP family protein, partial [Longicatena sp.]
LGLGNFYLFKTGSAFSRMTNDNTQTTVISVIVMKDNKAKNISDLKNGSVGLMKTGDSDSLNKAVTEIKKDTDNTINVTEYKSYETIANELYDGKINAIILDEGTRGLFEDNHSKFNTETRVIKTYKYSKKVNDISKNVKVTDESFNMYITGIDVYGGITTVSRSDVNMIATINPKTHQILLTSIPRDYYVPQPCQGNQKDKLTHTGIFGVGCTVSSVENYFGIDLNYYARVNFSSVVSIVDAIGGIEVDNPISFTDIDGIYSFPASSAGNLLPLKGEQALSFSRERQNLAGGDRDRGKNQMRVITGIVNKIISPSIITNYASIMDAVGGSFQTNMSNGEMTSLIKMQVNDMSGWDIEQIAVNGTGTDNTWSPANGFNSYVMIPDDQTVKKAVELINKVEKGEDVKPLVQQFESQATANE